MLDLRPNIVTDSLNEIFNDGTPRVELIAVTPKMAVELLKRNTKNRPMAQYWVNIYTEAMKDGTFVQGTQIAFDVKGVLADGQKRLQAIINSNVTTVLTVYFNCPEGYRGAADTGQPRDVATRLALTGTPCNRRLAAVAKIFGFAPHITSNRVDAEVLRRIIENYRDTLDWSLNLSLDNAVIMGTIARASQYNDRKDLERFAKIFRTGEYDNPSEIAPVKLAMFHSRNKGIFGGGTTTRNRAYRIVQYAIQAFLDGKRIKRCRELKSDVFPLNSLSLLSPALTGKSDSCEFQTP